MIFSNGILFRDGSFRPGSFRVEDGKFAEFLPAQVQGDVDLNGAFVLPGLVEIHAHGNSGCDFSDGDYAGLVKMAKYLLTRGVTSFAPASLTLPYDTLSKAFRNAARLHNDPEENTARLMGIQMEGPFFAESRKGAQNPAHLRKPDIEAFYRLSRDAEGLLSIVDIAPELEGAEEFIKEACKTATVSVAHTDASYEDARMAFSAGARHLTHLFNCMPGIHHRNPGVIGAASEREDVIAELICDGLHVAESAVRMAFKLFPGRICLISDALRCCGMPDGFYEIGGQPIELKNSIARLPDGTIAGSAADLYQCMRNAVRFGIPKEEAILAATIRPARQIGKDREIGSLDVDKLADFVLCDDDLDRKAVYLGGILQ